MEVKDILKKKGAKVFTIEPDDEICNAIEIMNRYNIGSIMVLKNEEVYGIITERDILRILHYKNCSKTKNEVSMKVSDHMTKKKDLITTKLNCKIDTVMDQMNKHKIRHIPVVENGKLFGIVSIGDLLKAILYLIIKRKNILEDYITSSY
ncbi:MAG: CBS domain-containing protein [Candidatus Marinimicrobia bacterium]|nr:CBS domain-containing protein [Candidatus Neomarinimicrobiota bacterium]